MNIYIGNLPFDCSENDVMQAFAEYGKVASVSLIKDRETGQMRGFGFVEMPDDGEARAAIAGLNRKELKGRPMTVNEARPRPERTSYGSGGFGRGGSGNRGGERNNRRSW